MSLGAGSDFEAELLELEREAVRIGLRIERLDGKRVSATMQQLAMVYAAIGSTETTPAPISTPCCTPATPVNLSLTNNKYAGTVAMTYNATASFGGFTGIWEGCQVVTSIAGGACAGGVSTALWWVLLCNGTNFVVAVRWKCVGGGNQCPVTSTCGDTPNTSANSVTPISTTCSPFAFSAAIFQPQIFGGGSATINVVA